MVALYIASSARGAGKTIIGAGLAKRWLGEGKKVGFLKPVIKGSPEPATGANSDAIFMKQLLALAEPADLICPVFSNESDLKNKIKEAYTPVAQDKEVVIIEGATELDQATRDIAETLDAKVIIVQGYARELPKTIDSYPNLGKYLLGIILNKVPSNQIGPIQAELTTQLEKTGVNILGILPEDRTLLAPTVGELAEHIQGEILSGAETSTELVENFMLGAMVVDSGLEYFGRKANKAVVVKSERPDMQLAALQTSTKCLVLTGNTAPKPDVLHMAEDKSVPVILAKDDMATVATKMGAALGQTTFSQKRKLPRLTEIMGQHLDFKALYQGLGLAS